MKYILILTLLLFIGCQKSDYEKVFHEIENDLGWVNDALPDEDFEKAVSSKDFRFLGIGGNIITTPGVDLNCISKNDIVLIKGTTYGEIGYEHAKLIAIATTYAKYYNIRMKMYLEDNEQFKCKT